MKLALVMRVLVLVLRHTRVRPQTPTSNDQR